MKCHGWLWTSGKGSSRLQLPPLFVDSHFTPLGACPCVAYGGAYREFQAILSQAFLGGYPHAGADRPKNW